MKVFSSSSTRPWKRPPTPVRAMQASICALAEGGTLLPFERALVPCGIALAIPEGYAGLIIPRSGLAARQGISIVNAPGLIDSGYRGEIKVPLINLDPTETFNYEKGERIAQLVIIATPSITLHNTYGSFPRARCGAQGFWKQRSF